MYDKHNLILEGQSWLCSLFDRKKKIISHSTKEISGRRYLEITFCFFIWANHKIKQSNLYLRIVTQPLTKNHFLDWCFNCSNIYSIWHLFGDTIKRKTSVCNKIYRVINSRAIALSITIALTKPYHPVWVWWAPLILNQ